MPEPGVYIVILNYKQWQVTLDCLLSLERSTVQDFKVLVVDNHSENDSLEHLIGALTNQGSDVSQSCLLLSKDELTESHLESEARAIFIQNDENRGFAAGNNVALELLQKRDAYIWLLNPDMVVAPDTLEQLLAFARVQNREALIGCVLMNHEYPDQLYCYGGASINFRSGRPRMIMRAADAHKLDYIAGGCLFTHAGNFKQLGTLPEQYFLYWEETDWCYGAKLAGHPLLVCPDAVCYDKISTSIGKGYRSDYYYARNALYFLARYRKRMLPVALFFIGIRGLRRSFSGQGERARGMFAGAVDFLKGRRYEGHKR